MTTRSTFHALWALAVCLLFSACSNTKYLPKGERLYIGSKVIIDKSHSDGRKVSKKALRNELSDQIRPKPNSKFLGLRIRLWLYNKMGTPKKKGIRHFIKYRAGEAPVLYSQVDPEKNKDIMKNHLQNDGFFQAQVTYTTKTDKRNRVQNIYTADVGMPYVIHNVIFPKGDSAINKEIAATAGESLLKQGAVFNLQTLKAERERIRDVLSDEGYFYFSPEDLIFKVDTTTGNFSTDIYIRLKPNLLPQATRFYTMNNIYIQPNFKFLNRDTVKKKYDTLNVDGYYYIHSTKRYKPKVITNSVFLEKGYMYRSSDHQITLNRFMNLGTFRFVNLRFIEVDSGKNDSREGKLDARISLSPLPRNSLRTELRLISKSNDFAGPTLDVSIKNRNVFRGAELFIIGFNGSFETVISGPQKGLVAYTLGTTEQLQIPRFIVPFMNINPPSKYVPKTVLKVGYQRLSQPLYYDLNSINFAAGYNWQETPAKSHEFYPVNITYLSLGRVSHNFDSILKRNYILRRSFEQQFILGSTYSYVYSTLNLPGFRRNDLYFNGVVDISGNMATGLNDAVKNRKANPDQPYTVLGKPYSQFSMLTLDLRHYLNFNIHHKLASRILAGFGLPYGNSNTLPYIKEYFIGGNNSIRAWRSRTLGPGSYNLSLDSMRKGYFIDEVGDIKLLGNLEYRFDISGMFKGAVFTDAGNIWTLHDDPQRPGGQFRWNTFANQIAVGSGIGLRLDASYFVLRFDLGFPIRKPYADENGHHWVINKIDFGNGYWRADNLVLNIGIGYPF